MRLPRNTAHYPSLDFIATHNKMLQLESFLPEEAEQIGIGAGISQLN